MILKYALDDDIVETRFIHLQRCCKTYHSTLTHCIAVLEPVTEVVSLHQDVISGKQEIDVQLTQCSAADRKTHSENKHVG